jgi:hypothetical protein
MKTIEVILHTLYLESADRKEVREIAKLIIAIHRTDLIDHIHIKIPEGIDYQFSVVLAKTMTRREYARFISRTIKAEENNYESTTKDRSQHKRWIDCSI